MFGDADGGITIVHFLRPLDSLFAKDEVDSVQCLFWPDMAKHEEFARYAAYLFNNENYRYSWLFGDPLQWIWA